MYHPYFYSPEEGIIQGSSLRRGPNWSYLGIHSLEFNEFILFLYQNEHMMDNLRGLRIQTILREKYPEVFL